MDSLSLSPVLQFTANAGPPQLETHPDIFLMTRLAVLLVLGLLAQCEADLDLEEETGSLNVTLGESGEEAGSGNSEDDDFVLVDNTETVDSDGGGAEFVDPADFVGSEVGHCDPNLKPS